MGFVKVHRSILDWEWYQDDRCVRLFLHILLKARYYEGRWQGGPLVPGQLPTSTVKLAGELGWSRSAVTRTLDKLKVSGEVNTSTNSKWTLVTVVNWAKWQDDDGKPDSKPNRKRTATGQQPDTLKEGKKERREEEVTAARSEFKSKCKEICDADAAILHPTLRQGFFDYWTEPNAAKVMRFEEEKYFDHARRMRNWQQKAIKSGDLKMDGDKHNPRA